MSNEVLEPVEPEALDACNMAAYASVGLYDHIYDELQHIQNEDLREYSDHEIDLPSPLRDTSLIEKEEIAVDILEEYFTPILEYLHGDGSKPRNSNTRDMKEALEDQGFDIKDKDHILNYEPGAEQLDRFYDNLKQEFERNEFDQILGVYSSGLPFAYLAESYLDTEEDLAFCRFSHHSRDDDQVLWTPKMISRFDPENKDILVIDDSWDTGKTARNVIEEFMEEASSVKLLTHRMKFQRENLENQPVEMEVRRNKRNGVLIGRNLDEL